MRVADRMSARNYLKHLHGAQNKAYEINQRVASGNRFTKLSDDVSAGSRVLRLRMDRYKAEKQLENAEEANAKLRITEDNMMDMERIIMYVHEQKAERALNDPSGDARNIYAAEIRSMMAEFVTYANASYGNMFNFGGSNAYTGPFTISDEGKLLYNSIDLDTIKQDPVTGKLMSFGEEVPLDRDIYFDISLGILVTGPLENPAVIGSTAFKVSYSGPELVYFGVDENGRSNNLYNIMNELQKNLEDFDREEAEIWNMKLRAQLDKFRINLTDIGVRTNFLEGIEEKLKKTIDNHSTRIDDLMGTKDEEEATAQMLNDYVLKAVLQLGSRMLPLSLMDFVR